MDLETRVIILLLKTTSCNLRLFSYITKNDVGQFCAEMSYLLKTLTKKEEIDRIIRDTIDEVLVLRFGRCSDDVCLQHDEIVLNSFLFKN